MKGQNLMENTAVVSKTTLPTYVRTRPLFYPCPSAIQEICAWSWGGSPGIEEEQEEYLKQQT